jgi:hypothetical protein
MPPRARLGRVGWILKPAQKGIFILVLCENLPAEEETGYEGDAYAFRDALSHESVSHKAIVNEAVR